MTHTYYKPLYKGNIYVWKYLQNQSNYPGINLTADEAGCDFVVQLLGSFKHFDNELTKRITMHPATQKAASVGTPKSKFESFTALILNFINDEEPVWVIEELSNDEIKITLSNFYLNELENAIKRVKAGEGDFLIADKKRKNILCLWWHVSA